MTRRRYKIVVIAALVLAVGIVLALAKRIQTAGGIGGAVTSVFVGGKKAIEQWCGEQLLEIAQDRLNPELRFDTLEYQIPATVTLAHVTLISDGVTFIEAASMSVEFTETPKRGRPIVIQTVTLTDPVVRLIRTSSGTLVGFTNLVKRAPDSAADERENAPRRKLSDVFAIRRIGVINGTVHYEIPDKPPMVLDQLTFDLTSTPSDEAKGVEAGWYSLNTVFRRPPIFEWKVDSRLNVDDALLSVESSNLQIALAAEHYSLLPPQLQSLVREREVAGRLTASVHGEIPMRRGQALRLDFFSTLEHGRMAFGDYVLPVDSLELTGSLSNETLSLARAEYAGLGGTLELSGAVELSDAYPLQATIDGHDVRIEEALRNIGEGPPKYAGKIDVSGKVTGDATSPGTTAGGGGTVSIRDGRLLNIPVISQLNRTAGNASKDAAGNDRGSANWNLAGDRIKLTAINLISGPLAARGEGEIGFDSSLNFRINAGPLERLQDELGGIGKLLGQLTDKLVAYYIGGTLEKPEVSVKPLDLGGHPGGNGDRQ